MWELLKVEEVQQARNENGRWVLEDGMWVVEVAEVNPAYPVKSGWVVPAMHTTFSMESKYDALWKMALVLNRCGVSD